MANTITIRGFVCSTVETRTTQTGLVLGNFRMGSTHRKQDPITNEWVDGDTNWFRINVFRSLAQNSVSSIHKGDRIIVMGKLHVTNFLRKDGTPGLSVEIDAETIGPDLQFGMAYYSRTGTGRAGTPGSQPGGTPEEVDAEVAKLEVSVAMAGQDAPEHQDDPEGQDDQTSGMADGETVDEATGEVIQEDSPF
ncbi:single-strand DNA-binding protein [Arthrobacter silviterrae]|uniref:Single-stranded DNA-binding protein n=1 Tax=Arthrobacter silviterrae TaxID=2026658 RepID=A0ABX0D693_9MICC|nr:single-stranded DNA-binding protein [Arthrobacter silviterrae]MDQ0276418.1 single-strand DNA-binding protein [Arthrobacter silviterrae]NGN82402.1 single-stranded DNA-binding protein [Arthrobacter silviterrae]